MALDFQLVIDCAEPHTLADWWADALGWEVEDTDEDFIRRMVKEGFATDDDTVMLDVYDREGLPCRRCRTTIERVVQAGRSTYYCPHCQPDPSPKKRAAETRKRARARDAR